MTRVTFAHPTGAPTNFAPWDDQARLIAQALGRTAEMDEVIADIEDRFAEAAAERGPRLTPRPGRRPGRALTTRGSSGGPPRVAGVRGAPDAEARETIVRVVVELLEAGGDDQVRLAEVARRARVSLARLYKLFGTRDELVVAAVERWMAEHAYAPLAATVPSGDRYEDLRAVLRAVFQPWERTPTMLRAFHRARSGRGGDRLVAQATTAIRPAVRAALEGADPEYVADVEIVLLNVFYAVFGRFADGDLPITEVLPTLERVAFRLTADNRPSVVGTRAARPS